MSPLVDAGFTKDDVRARRRRRRPRHLGQARRRVPLEPHPLRHGASRASAWRRLAASRPTLKRLGFRQVRVRYHGDLARIELGEDELARAADRRHRGAPSSRPARSTASAT